MFSPLTFSFFLLGSVKSETDALSNMIHRMSSLENELFVARNLQLTKPYLVLPCPASLSNYNFTIPEQLLSEQFSKEIDAVHYVARLLNNFLSHSSGTVSLDQVEPTVKSAAGILIQSEQRIQTARFCWFGDSRVYQIQPALHQRNLLCQSFHQNPDLSATSASLLPLKDAVQSITDNQKEFWPRVAEMWTRLTAADLSLSKRAGWTAPYLDCNSTWQITYLIALSGRQDVNLETKDNIVRGIFGMDIRLNKFVDVNQCGDIQHPGNPFAATHKCRRQSTMCVNVTGEGFRKGSYQCRCLPGFYMEGDEKFFKGTDVEQAFSERDSNDRYENNFNCFRCAPECPNCISGAPCIITYNIIARGLPLGALAFCITCSSFVGSAVYRYRKRKVIASATWPLLENIVIGAILIYSSVIVRYFHPSFHLCMAEPWLREMGFMLFYCAVVLKLYKVVTEFRTRKAHCVYVRDKDLVKYHVGIILITIGFMAAWTSVTMDLNRDGNGRDLLLTDASHDGRHHRICRLLYWDYVAETCEFMLLLWGIYLSYLARNSKTLYMERRLLTAAICVELVISTIFYVTRHVVWNTVHPDALYLLYFARSQLTVTVNMMIIFGGKVWYIFRPQDDPFRKNQAHGTQGRPAEMEKLHDGIFAGDLELNQIPLSDMDQSEIRMELRRLYAQMQVLKTKAMRQDNPHISKKKGGRKVPHRRFSIQAFKSQCSRHPKEDDETTAVKTPEESSASGENFHTDVPPTVYEEEASYVSPEHNVPIKHSLNNNRTRVVGFAHGVVTNL